MRSRAQAMQQTQFMAVPTAEGESESDKNMSFNSVRLSRATNEVRQGDTSTLGTDEEENGAPKKPLPFPWKQFFILSSLPIALAPIIMLATAAEDASTGYLLNRECYPNGLWSEREDATWRIMDSSYFFTPNLSFGRMTFTQVKIIDIAWDLVIGRGGQLLLAWVNYKVFNEWILYHMELHLTSYKMYTSVAFQTTTLTTLGVLAKEFLAFGKLNWRRFFRWLAMLSMLLSALYVLAFPTLMAAMTGYITTFEAYVADTDGVFIPSRDFEPVKYIIRDSYRLVGGERIPNPWIIPKSDVLSIQAVQRYVGEDADFALRPWESDWNRMENRTHLDTGNGTYRPRAMYHRYVQNRSSVWTSPGQYVELEAPTLMVEEYNGKDTMVPRIEISKTLKSLLWVRRALGMSGQAFRMYDFNYMLEHSTCQPTDTYQWGFSYIFMFMVSIFNFIWSYIMVGMWFDTSRASKMYKSGRRPGLLRSVLDLSRVIREELGDAAERMDEDDLRSSLTASGGHLLVPKSELRIARTTVDEVELRRRRKWTKGSTF